MFGWNTKKNEALKERVAELEDHCVRLAEIRNGLEDKNAELAAENKKLRQKKQMEEEMIAHKLKIREEQVEMDANSRIAEAEQKAVKQKNDAVAKVKDEYRDKIEKNLEKRGNEMKEMYGQILKRLPDVTMAITKDIKERAK
jgi:predicted metal-dependent hydrolase